MNRKMLQGTTILLVFAVAFMLGLAGAVRAEEQMIQPLKVERKVSHKNPHMKSEEIQAPRDIDGVKTVTAVDIFRIIYTTPELVIIDPRISDIFAHTRMRNAVNIPFETLNAATLSEAVPTKQTPVLFYCTGPSCGLAAIAATTAADLGYENVHYYYAGMKDWTSKGYPVEGHRGKDARDMKKGEGNSDE